MKTIEMRVTENETGYVIDRQHITGAVTLRWVDGAEGKEAVFVLSERLARQLAKELRKLAWTHPKTHIVFFDGFRPR